LPETRETEPVRIIRAAAIPQIQATVVKNFIMLYLIESL
jgi:hypothetical protein